MLVVEKKARGHSYLYLVESVRKGRKVRQRIIQPLGHKDVLAASGQLERLLQSVARHCDRSVALAAMEAGDVACSRIGAPLLFGRLWDQTGCAAVLTGC